jgi:hypothetical protein
MTFLRTWDGLCGAGDVERQKQCTLYEKSEHPSKEQCRHEVLISVGGGNTRCACFSGCELV